MDFVTFMTWLCVMGMWCHVRALEAEIDELKRRR
jgi:hypothetical protein